MSFFIFVYLSRYHKILGIPPGASKGQIKNAYRKLAKEFHPDRSTLPNAKEKFIEVSEAYEALYEGKIAQKKARQSQSRKTTPREKYWHVYRPPRNASERVAWEKVAEERKAYYQAKAKRQAEKRFQKFKEENNAFRKSVFYTPLLWLYRLMKVLAVAGNSAILFLPFIGKYLDPERFDEVSMGGIAIFVLIFIAPIVVIIFFQMISLKKIIDPYFEGY